MPSRPVQISLDEDLLASIDADPEAREVGRSAFVRSALRLYLDLKRKRRVDEAILGAYADRADTMLDEVEDLVRAQAWPGG